MRKDLDAIQADLAAMAERVRRLPTKRFLYWTWAAIIIASIGLVIVAPRLQAIF